MNDSKVQAGWVDSHGNVWPLLAYSVDGKANYHDAHKRGWGPLYRAAPAAVVQAEPSKSLAIAVRALERLARTPGCGCSFPCQCNGEEWTRAELEGRMDVADKALADIAARSAK